MQPTFDVASNNRLLDPTPIESAKFETITFTHVSVNSHGKFACSTHSTKGTHTHTHKQAPTHLKFVGAA